MLKVKVKLKLKIFFLAILFFAIFGASAKASAATYYVKNGGNDSLSGLDDANAWATPDRVMATAGYSNIVASGDTVYFRSQDTWTGDNPLLIATSGVAYDGSAYGTGTRAKLKATAISNTSTVRIIESDVIFAGFEVDGSQINSGGIYIGYSNSSPISNITVDNCVVHDQGQPTGNTQKYWMYGILVGAKANSSIVNTNINITNCEIYNTYHEGIAVYPSWGNTANCGNGVDGVIISHCKVYDNGTDNNDSNKSGNGIAIAVNNNSKNVTIEWCDLYDTGAVAPGQIYGISVRDSLDGPINGIPTDLVVRYNLIRNNTKDGIIFQNFYAQDQTSYFYNNLIYNNVGYGINFSSSDYGNSEFGIYNNTLYAEANGIDTFVGCIGFSRDSSTISGTPTFNLKNNILSVVTTSISAYDYIPMYADIGSGTLIHNNNLYYRSSGTDHVYVSTGNWGEHIVYDGEGDNIITAAWEPTAKITVPTFAGGTLPTGFSGTYGTNLLPNADYFKITSGDAINNGATIGSPYYGNINTAGTANPIARIAGAYDIGAYEYFGTDTTSPITPQGLSVE
ncbi:MAG: right-handed parallel beta-helix repeat-containing protein [Parcubacteria group bacterium]|jgi:hypothetical protein